MEHHIPPRRYGIVPSTRLAVCAVLYVATLLHYAIRFALNMSVVCMVISEEQINGTLNDQAARSNDSTGISIDSQEGKKKTEVRMRL